MKFIKCFVISILIGISCSINVNGQSALSKYQSEYYNNINDPPGNNYIFHTNIYMKYKTIVITNSSDVVINVYKVLDSKRIISKELNAIKFHVVNVVTNESTFIYISISLSGELTLLDGDILYRNLIPIEEIDEN